LELVRYIHLNPLRAKLVVSIGELDRYEFCGHGVILGKHQKDWQEIEKLLGMFGKGTGNEWSAGGALVGHRPVGSPVVGCSRGENCARVESGDFPLTKH